MRTSGPGVLSRPTEDGAREIDPYSGSSKESLHVRDVNLLHLLYYFSFVSLVGGIHYLWVV